MIKPKKEKSEDIFHCWLCQLPTWRAASCDVSFIPPKFHSLLIVLLPVTARERAAPPCSPSQALRVKVPFYKLSTDIVADAVCRTEYHTTRHNSFGSCTDLHYVGGGDVQSFYQAPQTMAVNCSCAPFGRRAGLRVKWCKEVLTCSADIGGGVVLRRQAPPPCPGNKTAPKSAQFISLSEKAISDNSSNSTHNCNNWSWTLYIFILLFILLLSIFLYFKKVTFYILYVHVFKHSVFTLNF